MVSLNLKNLIVGAAMLTSAGLAIALTPHEKIADHGPKINLETMIPKQFGDWKLDETIAPIQANPEVQAKLDRIYNQTLTRTYVNGRGEHIMLSLAYGGDQSDSMQIHRPEVCYPSQGFQVSSLHKTVLESLGGIPAMRLVAQEGERVEPITYWIVVGNKTATSGLTQKLAQLSYGLTGKVPDGMLVRISSLSGDADSAYQLHADFARQMIQAVRPEDRHRLLGSGEVLGL
jgi:EpsI family protein